MKVCANSIHVATLVTGNILGREFRGSSDESSSGISLHKRKSKPGSRKALIFSLFLVEIALIAIVGVEPRDSVVILEAM